MPSVTRPRRANPDQAGTVQRHVLAAVERLLAGGAIFTELGIGRIAEEAGIGRSTFYGHFPDKPTLLISLAREVTVDPLAQARRWAEDPDHTRAGLEDTLLTLVRDHRRHGPLLRAITELSGYEPTVREFWREQIDGFAAVLARRLERDKDTGRAPADLDAGPTASWIAWGTERAIALQAERALQSSDAAFAKAVAGAVWASLRRP